MLSNLNQSCQKDRQCPRPYNESRLTYKWLKLMAAGGAENYVFLWCRQLPPEAKIKDVRVSIVELNDQSSQMVLA